MATIYCSLEQNICNLELEQNKTKSKVFSLERFYKFCIKKILGPKKILCQKKIFKEKFGSQKFWSEKKFCLKKFWFKKMFGTNKIFGLRIFGPKKFRIWKKIGVQKNLKKRNLRPK